MKQLIFALGLLSCLAAPAVSQQAFPSQPITLVVPYAPGGAADLLARSLGHAVSAETGQNVVVDNRPGGATVIGAQATLGKPADGYTGFVVAASFVINPHLMQLSFDPLKDFQPVALLATNPHVLVVSSKVPASTLPEFIEWALGKKGSANYSSFGNGSSGHIGFELLKQMTKIEATHVAYKGGAPSTMAVVSGEVDATLADVGVMAPHIKAGKVKAIAITGDKRNSVLPNVPTFTESGLPNYTSQTWVGLWVRKGVPSDRVQKLNQLFTNALQGTEIQKLLVEQGMQARPTTSDQFRAFAQSESDKYRTAIQRANIKLE
jgi:tripartite-type tricarboxylate transporter receptor subunit TctC